MAYCNDMNGRAERSAWTNFFGDGYRRWMAGFAERRRRAKRAWIRHRTEVEISRLAPEIRKDIGWPTRHDY